MKRLQAQAHSLQYMLQRMQTHANEARTRTGGCIIAIDPPYKQLYRNMSHVQILVLSLVIKLVFLAV
jgi:hypothetical protein